MSWTIRRATPIDAAVIIDFNCRLALETEGKQLDTELLTAGVERALHDPNKALYFVAHDDQKTIVGQVMITFEWSDWRNGWIWWIQSAYVRRESRRQGVFRSMLETVKAAAKDKKDVVALRLYVDQQNVHAQETYYRLGMKRTEYFVLEQYPLSD